MSRVRPIPASCCVLLAMVTGLANNQIMEERYPTCILSMHDEYVTEANRFLQRLSQNNLYVGRLIQAEPTGISVNCKNDAGQFSILIPWAALVAVSAFSNQRVQQIGFC